MKKLTHAVNEFTKIWTKRHMIELQNQPIHRKK